MQNSLKIDVLTTLIPSHENDLSLERINPILNLVNSERLRLNIINKYNDLPMNSKYKNLINKNFQIRDRSRPIIKDYYSKSLSDWIVLANSDIFFFFDIEETINQLNKHNIGFASCRRYDTDYFDLIFKHHENKGKLKDFLSLYCKLQSRRTLDFFLIRKDIFKLIVSKDKANLVPGTVMFDINLFILGSKLTKTADLSNNCSVIHKNHEQFRLANRLNIITSLKKRNEFVIKRKTHFDKDISKGCLTNADFKFKKNELVFNNKFMAKINYKLESLRIKIVNNIEIIAFRFNYCIYKFNKNSKLYNFYGLVFILPKFSKNNLSREYTFDIFLKESFKLYMKKKLKRFFS